MCIVVMTLLVTMTRHSVHCYINCSGCALLYQLFWLCIVISIVLAVHCYINCSGCALLYQSFWLCIVISIVVAVHCYINCSGCALLPGP